MIASMTGFGSGRAESPAGSVAVEARSVNHRFREVKVRLPREISAFEPVAVARIAERLERGAVDVSVRIAGGRAGAATIQVDETLAGQVVSALRTLGRRHGLAGDVDVATVAGVEGVVTVVERPLEVEALRDAFEAALGEALDGLAAMRREEGAVLARDLSDRLDRLAEVVDAVDAEAGGLSAAYRDRLEKRLAALLPDAAVDPGRLEAEVAILVDRSDVSEEITRLKSHVDQFRELLAGEAPAVGRRLGFLLQEMNRETNTIGSKSQSLGISRHAVEMKAELERMREQVQNVE